ncbi:transposable element Tc1 transposase [Trichonephila clavipes]|nr:transposable element Tc1 transposase [Trichonephila clavipes]
MVTNFGVCDPAFLCDFESSLYPYTPFVTDDNDTKVDNENELSLEQKLELAITKKISTNQNKYRNQLFQTPSDEKSIYLKMRDLEVITWKKVAIRKPLSSAWNEAKRLQWCRYHLKKTQLQWEQVIGFDKFLFTLFLTTGYVFVWQTPAAAFHVDCLVPTVEPEGSSVMVCDAISSLGLGPLVVYEGDKHSRLISRNFHRSTSPGERSKMSTPLFPHFTVYKYDYMSMMITWDI